MKPDFMRRVLLCLVRWRRHWIHRYYASWTAFATNFHADYFLNPQISMGPHAQLAVAGDLFQFGLSGQLKYWLDLPGLDKRLKMNLQEGSTFWLPPPHVLYLLSDTERRGLGRCAEPVGESHSTSLFNFIDVNTGRGTGANVMPGRTFGIRL